MKNHGGKPAKRRGSGARALHPGCTGSKKHGLCPLPTLSSKKQPGALSQSLIYFLEGRASQDGKRKRRHSRVNFFEWEAICTLGTISTVFFDQSPDCQRPRCLGPSTFELLTRPGPAAYLYSSISPGLFWTPGGPPPRPQVRAGEKQLSSPLCFCFPFTRPPAHLAGPPAATLDPPREHCSAHPH